MQQTLKNSSERVVVYLYLRGRRVARLMSRRQLLFSMSLILLFILAFIISINHIMKLIQIDSFCLLVWKMFSSNGSSILAQLVGLFVNGLSGLKPSISILTTKNPAETGSIYFSDVTLILSYLPHAVLIQNVPKHLTI